MPEQQDKSRYLCKYCNRSFTTESSLSRHTNHSCREKWAQIKTQMEEINEKLELVAANSSKPTIQANIQQIVIQPWDGEKCISVGISHILAAFAGNQMLKKYVTFTPEELADPNVAPPYVAELLMDLTRRAHENPSARNLYLQKPDQVLVLTKNGWEPLSLTEVTSKVLDEVAVDVKGVTRKEGERRRLTLEEQNALAIAGMLYDENPTEYVDMAKEPMAAHLQNCRPAITS